MQGQGWIKRGVGLAGSGLPGVMRWGALGIALLVAAVWGISFPFQMHGLPHVYFEEQDWLVLAGGAVVLFAASWLTRVDGRMPLPHGRRWVLIGILAALLLSWAGSHLVFYPDYPLSYDEQSIDFAAHYMRDGLMGRPVPPEWRPFFPAMMTDFVKPFESRAVWASGYLPVSSAMRAAFLALGAPTLTNPVLLAIGLFALWVIARRLFPAREDVRLVIMLLALSSSQLLMNAMTPYAMTAHFTFNMIWLALLLRGGKAGHLGALIVGFLAMGLHQAQFHPMFAAGFIPWLWLRGERKTAVLYAVAYTAFFFFWSSVYRAFLIHMFGPMWHPVGAPHHYSAIAFILSKFSRLVELAPLLSLSRFVAWNNLLLLPLAFFAMIATWAGWKDRQSPILPLTIGCLLGLTVMIEQGYGWGYRYLHGYIGSFCLLAGYGWQRLRSARGQDEEGVRSGLIPVLALSALSLLVILPIQCVMAHRWAQPYARMNHLIRTSGAQVALVDDIGGAFMSDLVRVPNEGVRPPVTLMLSNLNLPLMATLCARYSDIQLFDGRQGRRLGIRSTTNARRKVQRSRQLRTYMAEQGCGKMGKVPLR